MVGRGTIGGGADRPGRVAYQGAPGAFSHEACAALRPWDQAVGFATFQEAIGAVTSGDCDCALIPVENAIVGRVEPAATLVEASGLKVITEVWRPIRLALMAVEGARLSDLKTVESHPVALAQCGPQIAKKWLTSSSHVAAKVRFASEPLNGASATTRPQLRCRLLRNTNPSAGCGWPSSTSPGFGSIVLRSSQSYCCTS